MVAWSMLINVRDENDDNVWELHGANEMNEILWH